MLLTPLQVQWIRRGWWACSKRVGSKIGSCQEAYWWDYWEEQFSHWCKSPMSLTYILFSNNSLNYEFVLMPYAWCLIYESAGQDFRCCKYLSEGVGWTSICPWQQFWCLSSGEKPYPALLSDIYHLLDLLKPNTTKLTCPPLAADILLDIDNSLDVWLLQLQSRKARVFQSLIRVPSGKNHTEYLSTLLFPVIARKDQLE